MSKKHTPAPWRLEKCARDIHERQGIIQVRASDNSCVWVIFKARPSFPPPPISHIVKEDEANAHLIAAAPEMYEALEGVHYWMTDPKRLSQGVDFNTILRMVKAAIKKAQGEGGGE